MTRSYIGNKKAKSRSILRKWWPMIVPFLRQYVYLNMQPEKLYLLGRYSHIIDTVYNFPLGWGLGPLLTKIDLGQSCESIRKHFDFVFFLLQIVLTCYNICGGLPVFTLHNFANWELKWQSSCYLDYLGAMIILSCIYWLLGLSQGAMFQLIRIEAIEMYLKVDLYIRGEFTSSTLERALVHFFF